MCEFSGSLFNFGEFSEVTVDEADTIDISSAGVNWSPVWFSTSS